MSWRCWLLLHWCWRHADGLWRRHLDLLCIRPRLVGKIHFAVGADHIPLVGIVIPAGIAMGHEGIHDMLLLVDLDRVDGGVAHLAAARLQRASKSAVQPVHLAAQDVGEAHQHRQRQAGLMQVIDQLAQVDLRTAGCMAGTIKTPPRTNKPRLPGGTAVDCCPGRT